MHKLILSTLFISLFSHVTAQTHLNTDTISDNPVNKILVRAVASDSLSSTFIIFIGDEVKPHYHQFHTENVMVIEGEGEMSLDGKIFKVKKGDLIVIPAGTIHSVLPLKGKTLKVISVQSPYFDGSDRILVDQR
ncbi:MAG: cupin domain-containing protein [Flavobacteriales bacterium]|nr:cupin domain-containing protein [Flavobacteriales bacterium]